MTRDGLGCIIVQQRPHGPLQSHQGNPGTTGINVPQQGPHKLPRHLSVGMKGQRQSDPHQTQYPRQPPDEESQTVLPNPRQNRNFQTHYAGYPRRSSRAKGTDSSVQPVSAYSTCSVASEQDWAYYHSHHRSLIPSSTHHSRPTSNTLQEDSG
jgi:hypothetical protein